jgi:ribose 5-phosphate isomerase B
MRIVHVGIATDHGGFGLKQDLVARLRAAGHDVVDFGADDLNPDDDYPDFVIPLAQAGGGGDGRTRGGGFSAGQGVEDDHMNIICIGGRTIGPGVAWDLVQTFLAAEFSHAPRHLRRLSKVAFLELQPTRTN